MTVVVVRLPEELVSSVDGQAALMGITRAAAIRFALKKFRGWPK